MKFKHHLTCFLYLTSSANDFQHVAVYIAMPCLLACLPACPPLPRHGLTAVAAPPPHAAFTRNNRHPNRAHPAVGGTSCPRKCAVEPLNSVCQIKASLSSISTSCCAQCLVGS